MASSNASGMADFLASLSQGRLSLDDKNDNSRVVTKLDENLANLRSSVGGLHYSNVPAGALSVLPFEGVEYIPIVDGGAKRLIGDAVPQYLGVLLEDIVTASGKHAKSDIRTSLGIPKQTKLIVLLHGNDLMLNKFAPNEYSIYGELSRQRQSIDLVVPPNWSVWTPHPLVTQRINQKRGLRSYQRLDQEGISAIPHFFLRYGSLANIRETARWINKRPSIGVVALNLQTYEKDEDWSRIVLALRSLKDKLDHVIHFLVIGPTTCARVNDIAHIFGTSFTLMNTEAAMKASFFRELRLEGTILQEIKHKKVPNDQAELFGETKRDVTPAELFSRSCETYTKLVATCTLQNSTPDIDAGIRKLLGTTKPISDALIER